MFKRILMVTGLLVLLTPFLYSSEKAELITGFEDDADSDSWSADDALEIVAENAKERRV